MKINFSHVTTFVLGVVSGLVSNSLYSEYVSVAEDKAYVKEASAEIATRLHKAHQRGVTFTAYRNSLENVREVYTNTESQTELSQFEGLRMDNLLTEVSKRTESNDLKKLLYEIKYITNGLPFSFNPEESGDEFILSSAESKSVERAYRKMSDYHCCLVMEVGLSDMEGSWSFCKFKASLNSAKYCLHDGASMVVSSDFPIRKWENLILKKVN